MAHIPKQPDAASQDAIERLTGQGLDYSNLTHRIVSIPMSRRTPRWWWIGFGISFLLTIMMLFSIGYLLLAGVGIWGINIPVAWGFAIINFVWWIGIGHAGTLISAILLLCRQQWRTSINRFAEAMTLFAVACAGLFPLLHLGRIDRFYYIMPYPNTMGLWPQFRSALVWDVFAISTYGTVSLLFWYVGLVPDFATMRDRSITTFKRRLYGALALGWRNSARHWHRYQMAYLLLAGLATPLVVSVHTIVSLDFATSVLPGWHTTIFPPYFVAGAVFSGFAMVLTLAIPLRRAFNLYDFITDRHLDNMAKIMLVTGLIVAYGYAMEIFIGWYGANPYELYMTINRMVGPYAPLFWLLIFCNVVVTQTLWFPWVRRNPIVLFFVAIIVNIGMWLERFVIVITSLHRDFLPSSWHMYYPTFWDWSLYIGTIGLFLALFFLFIRLLPMISIFEVRELVHYENTQLTKGPHV
jgi:Ni/Fe-hydrogenase subunit HybB-like protein